MAGAEIIASAIGILCLIIFGYILVGGILTTGENAASAQKDYILMKESQRDTAINIPHSPQPEFSCENKNWWIFWSYKECTLTFNITNTGSEPIGDFGHMDVFVNTSEDIVRGPSWLPDDVLTPAGALKYHKFDQYTIGSGGEDPTGNWSYIQIFPTPEIIHPNMLDSNEKMEVKINNFRFLNQPANFMITVVTPNGVTDTYIK